MSSAQKLIKIVAIAFAVLLIVSIISVIAIGITGIASIGNLQDTQDVAIYEEVSRVLETDENVLNLDIDISASKLQVNTGEKFVVETNNKYVSCVKEQDKLVVKEKKHSWNMNLSDSIVVIYTRECETK